MNGHMETRRSVRVGQFSSSPVLGAARVLGLDARHGLDVVARPVPSSPGQFALLRDDDIDVAITSPDNVLLYATTDNNPLHELLPVRMIRAIDHGLGLSLVTRPDITALEDFVGARLGVDVVRSGFALLLFSMLARLDVDQRSVTFAEHGSTPNRLKSLLAGQIDGTIVNAESRVRAVDAGMRVWSTSVDVSASYLGTVLAVRIDCDPRVASGVVSMWDDTTRWLLEASEADVIACLGSADPALGNVEYARLLRDPSFGLIDVPSVEVSDLRVLASIRRQCGAYEPDDATLASLVGL
jgi:ABC-type nitrate/sulfonate/bicarbonate transport system substrate-binding protein